MTFDPQTMFLFVLGQFATAAGVYAAIRADLREALTRCTALERRMDRVEDERHNAGR